MAKNIKILYINQGIPQIIDEINKDITTAVKQLNCQLETIDLDPVNNALKAKDYDLRRQLQTETINKITAFQPDLAMGYGFRGIMQTEPGNHLLNMLNIPYAGLFFDNPLYHKDLISHCSRKDNVLIFCHDRALLPTIKHIGFNNSFFFPIATSMNDFHCGQPAIEKPLLFVGGVSMPMAIHEWTKNLGPVEKCFSEFAFQQVMTYEEIRQSTILEQFEAQYPEHNGYFKLDDLSFQSMWFRLDKGLTSELRLQTVNAIADFGIRTCGSFLGWKKTFGSNDNVATSKNVNYRQELPGLYRYTPITVNRSPINLQDAIQQRILDVGAAGGFILTDYRPILDDFFEIGRDIEVYHNMEELRNKVDYYLKHPEERLEIAANLHLNVLKNHTWKSRLRNLLANLKLKS